MATSHAPLHEHTTTKTLAMADEVEALKRELAVLKLQLEQERKKNAADNSQSHNSQSQPERAGSKTKRREGDAKPAASSTESRVYVQHATVGARRGKWWLKDRQVLSRTTSEDGATSLKVRETWVWSGRTVVLDKIVRLDEQADEKTTLEVTEEVDNAKPDQQPDSSDIANEVSASPAEAVAAPMETVFQLAQQSQKAETSEAVSVVEKDADAVETLPDKTVDEEAAPAAPSKADDEIRESSTPSAEPPPYSAEVEVDDAM
ncbi:unnamed protein product [Phytophthora lilii]|uniref:Unnamed protein product n=1 Tax=Phytophthora lilii TaxID=2077276 RepID=A0A9W6UES0_9STRA|nr:unnamed protein product [Phytophthora lilii]